MATATKTRPPRRASTQLSALAPEGIITIVGAVTGVPDQVGDLIAPTAFARTLLLRRPKVCVQHSWAAMVGRVLYVEELLPGSAKLPKTTKDGKPWPAAAGAVVATVQFNMDTQAGREAYSNAKFYSQNNECEWSIGYKVVENKVSRRSDGVRVIYDLDLFEFSLVLFGAASQTMTLETKGLDGLSSELHYRFGGFEFGTTVTPGSAMAAVMQAKALNAAAGDSPTDRTDPTHAGLAVMARDTGRVLMLQRGMSDKEDPARGLWEFPGGGIEDGEQPHEGAVREWEEETGHKLPAGDEHDSWDSPNGVYRGHTYVIPSESDLTLNPDHKSRKVKNPDDPKGKDPEQTAWFDPNDLPDMPSLRPECRSTPWDVLHDAVGTTPASDDAPLEGKSIAPDQINPADIAYLRRVVYTSGRQVYEAGKLLADGQSPQVQALATQRKQQGDAAIRRANKILADALEATVDPNQTTPVFDEYDARPAAFAVTEAKALGKAAGKSVGRPITKAPRKGHVKHRCAFCSKDATVHRAWMGGEKMLCADHDTAAALEGKTLGGPHDTSPVGTPGGRQNWVDGVGGLPPYIREIAHALMVPRGTHDESAAIAMAVAACKRWAEGGDGVDADTQAKSAEAVAAWEADKAANHSKKATTKATTKASAASKGN